MTEEPFFLFIGSVDREAATSQLKASGTSYRRKMLESAPENWKSIDEILSAEPVIGVVMKLTSHTASYLYDERYRQLGERIAASVSRIPHVVVVHENVLSGKDEEATSDWAAPSSPLGADGGILDEIDWYEHRYYFSPPPQHVQEYLRSLAVRHDLNIMPYVTNAELSVIVANFVQDYDKKLLFRIYVPTNRLGASEADKLLNLFREWMAKLKGQRIRQDGYATGHGRVYEFYNDGDVRHGELVSEMQEFSDFLETCLDNPDVAADFLVRNGIHSPDAGDIIRRFARDVRRLKLDLKHEHETRMLAIRQKIEAELLEVGGSPEGVNAAFGSAIPRMPELLSSVLDGPRKGSVNIANVVVNQQIIEKATGIIAQELSGAADLTLEARQLLDIVGEHGGDQAVSLQSAVHELEDEDSPPNDRLTAGKKLQGFLFKVRTRLEDVIWETATSYIQDKLAG